MYDRLEVEDYTETNNRDYFLHEDSTGKKLHQRTSKEYRNARQTAYNRRKGIKRDRTEYNNKYYKEHREEILKRAKENYDTKTNTTKCRKYRKNNLEKRKQYEKQYYELHKEEKRRKARERYYINKLKTQSA